MKSFATINYFHLPEIDIHSENSDGTTEYNFLSKMVKCKTG